MTPPRSRSRTLVLSVLMALFSLAVGEAFVRAVLPPRWLVKRHPQEDVLLTQHPLRGYALRPNLVRRWVQRDGDFDVEVRLNANGQRDGELAEALRSRLRMLAAGDSYTFGIGVEDGERWSERLERSLNSCVPGARASVYNAGVPGYGATQIRQTIEEIAPLLEPQIVMIGVYANSYWRVATPYVLHGGTLIVVSEARYVETASDGSLVTTAFGPGRLRDLDLALKRFFHLGAHVLSVVNGARHWPVMRRRLDETTVRAEYQSALREFAATHEWLRDRGARLVLMAINGQQADGSFLEVESLYNSILREFAQGEGIVFVEPLPDLVRGAAGQPLYRFEHDLHWSPAAHAVAAGVLETRLREADLISSVSPCRGPDGGDR